MEDYNFETWKSVMELKKAGQKETTQEVANILSKDDVNTILATADFFGADRYDLAQIHMDLTIPRYRVFDWLAMGIGGRIRCQEAVKVFVYSFLKVGGVPSKFIEDLRITDYDVVRDWEQVKL